MSRKVVEAKLQGEPGHVSRVPADWIGWSGLVAHPDSPAGGGGPGQFAPAGPLGLQADDPATPAAPAQVPLQGTRAPTHANLAPRTVPRSLGTLLSVLDALFDIRIEAEVIADGTGTRAGTTFSGTRWTWPSAGPQRKEKLPIERFVGKFIWRSTIQIQTVYARPEDANRVSCYGRGTTLEDVQARDITLGFHESCHRADFVSYLSANSLPAPPKLRVGMTWEEYDTVKQSFTAAVEAYFKAMEQYSQSKTDEVGHAKSDWLASGRTKCFLHILP